METIVKERMVEYLEKSNLFSDKQHGFTRGRSCLTNLLETFKEWMQALDDGHRCIIYRNAFSSNVQQKCSVAAARVMSIMKLVKRIFKNLDMKNVLVLYQTDIHPNMDYCLQVWSPHLTKDITLLEQAQSESMKLVKRGEKERT